MSSGYVSGPSRSAWEGATFWQRMNPGSMTCAPVIRNGVDTLAAYVEERERTCHMCPSCHKPIRHRGYERHLRACSHYHWRNRDVPF